MKLNELPRSCFSNSDPVDDWSSLDPTCFPEFFFVLRDSLGRCWRRPTYAVNHQCLLFTQRALPSLDSLRGSNLPLEDMPEFRSLTPDTTGCYWDDDQDDGTAILSPEETQRLADEDEEWTRNMANGADYGLLI